MLLSLLILVNIGVIAYFGSVFIRLYEDVKSINEELEDLKQGITKLEHSIKVEKTEKEEKFLEYNMSLKSLADNLKSEDEFHTFVKSERVIRRTLSLQHFSQEMSDIIRSHKHEEARKSNESIYDRLVFT